MGADEWKPYVHSEGGGDFQGFIIDIAKGMETLCGASNNFKFEFVRVPWEECWNESALGSKIQDGTVDACLAYYHTHLRDGIVDFSGSIAEAIPSGYLTKLDDDGLCPLVSPYSDLAGKKIAHRSGWLPEPDGVHKTSNNCTGAPYSDTAEYVPFNSFDQMLGGLLNNTVDLMMVLGNLVDAERAECTEGSSECSNWNKFGTEFAYVQSGEFKHTKNGLTLTMAKKDSDTEETINSCLTQYLETEEYYKVCQRYEKEHECIRNDFFPADVVTQDWEKKTSEQTSCDTGYCSCDCTPLVAV